MQTNVFLTFLVNGFPHKKALKLTTILLYKGGLGAAAAGFLAFRSSTTSSRAFNSDNVAFLSILKALDDEEMLESEFKSTPNLRKT